MEKQEHGILGDFKTSMKRAALVGVAAATAFGIFKGAQRTILREPDSASIASYVPMTQEQQGMLDRYKMILRSRGVEELRGALRTTQQEPEITLGEKIEKFGEYVKIAQESAREAESESRMHRAVGALELREVSQEATLGAKRVVEDSATGRFVEGLFATIGLISALRWAAKKIRSI